MKDRSQKIILLACSILISSFLAELVLESFEFFREWKENMQVEPFYPTSSYTSRGERIRGSGYLKLVMHPFMLYKNLPNQKTPYFTINSLGFRGKELNSPLPHGKKRIIVLGGSTVFGTGLRRDEESFVAQLEQILGNTEVINAGVDGYHSSQELIYVLTELIDLKPDLIIALDGWNDFFYRNVNYEFSAIESRLEAFSFVTNNFFLRFKKMFRFLFPAIGRFIDRLRRIMEHQTLVTPENEKWSTKDISTSAYFYSKNIIKMEKILRSYHCNFLCALQPRSSKKAKLKYLEEKYSTFRHEVKEYFVQNQIHYLDLNDYRTKITSDMFLGVVHLNAIGNLKMAEIVSENISKNKLLDLIKEPITK